MCDSNKILSFLPKFSSLIGTTDDEIDKFITYVHGKKSGRALAQRITITSSVNMNLKVLRFELDDRNKCNALPDAAMLAAIYISQLIFTGRTLNQDDHNSERLK